MLVLQAQATPSSPPALATASAVRATRTAEPVILDGRDDDAVWRSTQVIDRFLEARPSEGAPPRLRTEARVAYDDHNLYVFVRAIDYRTDSIVVMLYIPVIAVQLSVLIN